MFKPFRLLPVAALLLASGCAYDYASGQAPDYPPGYDSGMGSGQYEQPGDLFGGQDVASVDVFYEPLSQYGRWVDSRFGRAFQPDVDRDWRPYVNGRWGEDRLWISDDPWGWATDHYGRWGFDDRTGWVWVPGTQWGPSWVAWREDEQQDVTGWAPIPPGVSYSFGVGFGSGFGYDNYNSWYGPSWVWVPRSYIYQPGFGGRILPWNRGYDYWRGSRWNYQGGWNGGWNGRPNYGRPNYGRPNYGRPNYGRPGYGRPNDGRPSVGGAIGGSLGGVSPRPRPDGNWQGRPGNGQYQGRPGGNAYQPRPDGNAYRPRPDGNGNQPRPGGNTYQPRPDGGQYQGRPGGNTYQPRPGQYQGRRPGNPGGVGNAIGGGMTGQRPPAYRQATPQAPVASPPPQQRAAQPPQRVEQPRAEQPRAERPAMRSAPGGERRERPE